MSKIKVAVMGYGHIGSYAVRAAQLAKDMDFLGVIELESRLDLVHKELPGVPAVKHYSLLSEKPDVVVLGIPTRAVEKVAPELLKDGISTVDPFDMHGEPFKHLKSVLDPIAREHKSAAIMGVGVDPGVSTMVRALFEIWAPTGLTYVSFGPGMSMGHTVAAKSHKGVKDALSITRPGAPGVHERDLYLVIEDGFKFEDVKADILTDSYFSHDVVRVFEVKDVNPLIDVGHSIHISRKGGSSGIDNQLLQFETTFHNPASTAQVMVAGARAVTRMAPGAHTMLEIPLGYFLPESIEELMLRLV